MLELIDRMSAGAMALVRIVCIALVSAIFVIIVYAVVVRYALTGIGWKVPSWTEEVPRYLLIWISFLAGAACIARREHVAFDIVFNAVPIAWRRVLGAAIGVLVLGFGWIVFRYGIVFVEDFGSDLMETIPFTNYWYYTAMPISGALMILFACKFIADAWRDRGEAGLGKSVD